MAQLKHLTKAPIKEAIIDIRVELPEEITVQNIKKTLESLNKSYPEIKPIRYFTGSFELKEGQDLSAKSEDHGIKGYQAWTKEKTQAAQFRLDGFTFSKLRPYSNWEQIKEEAKILWSLYCKEFKPSLIKRLAVRVINQFSIPEINFELNDYFTWAPNIGEALGCHINHVFLRSGLNIEEINGQAILTLASVKSREPQKTSFLLDSDVFVVKEFPLNEEAIWTTMDKLSKWKNQLFFKSLTEKTLEPYL